MPRVICLGMAALDAIYRVPAIPVKPVKVIASSFGESGDVGARILRGLADEGADIQAVRRISGATSSSDAILIDPAGERLICAYTDPALDADAGWPPLERVA